MSTNLPNLKQIGGGHCKTLVDLTRNAKRASGDLHRIWRNRELPIPLKEKTCSINDLADNELRFRDMDISKVRTELDQLL